MNRTPNLKFINGKKKQMEGFTVQIGAVRQHPLERARVREPGVTIHGLFMIITDGKPMNRSKYLQIRRNDKIMIFMCTLIFRVQGSDFAHAH